jgi:hypothetical protein
MHFLGAPSTATALWIVASGLPVLASDALNLEPRHDAR